MIDRDIRRLGSSHVSVDFENDRTRVLRLTLAAGESIPIHDDRAGVLVCVAGCRIRFTRPDGQSQDIELKAGETRWMPDARHATQNIADAPLEILYIETQAPATVAPPSENPHELFSFFSALVSAASASLR